ncbi:MAG TPA: helix-turn-helix domain-containing protein [Verrucomicrobiae bacterium]|nr:helix-turn-helix domain-containing protein [Verrucomicrobiae bacterium]
MLFITRQPCLELRDYVDFFWFYEGLSPAHRLERVLPDGTFELCINLRDEVRHTYDLDDHRPTAAYRRAWLSGTHARHIIIDTAMDSSMMGVHFKPAGAACVLDMPAGEMTDRVVELDAIWGSSGIDLHNALLEAPTPDSKFAVLERFLLRSSKRSRARSPAIRHALHWFTAEPTMTSIDTVATELGVSHKHLIQRFRDEVGLTPKRFCRIRRFRSVLNAMQNKHTVDWADLAYACGYFDQAHFIREFRDFSGLNPSAYLTQRGEHLGFVPVAD